MLRLRPEGNYSTASGLCATIRAFSEASYGSGTRLFTAWFYVNFPLTPLLVGNIYFYVFLDTLGGKHLGVTLWASQVCPYIISSSLGEVKSPCAPSPERSVLHPEALCPSMHKACCESSASYLWTCSIQLLSVRNLTLSTIPYLKL